MKKRYIYPILCFLTVYFFGTAIFYFCSLFITKMVYPTLNDILPDLFPLPNYVFEAEEYEMLQRVLMLPTLLLCFLILARVSLFFDNARFEHVIRKTDGMYRMKDGLKLYYSSFLLSDVIISLLVPVGLTLPVYIYVPKKYIDMIFSLFFTPAFNCYRTFGYVRGAVILVFTTLVCRLLAGIFATRGYRARWLSSDVA